MSMCRACGIEGIKRIELSRRYKFRSSEEMNRIKMEALSAIVHDRMTECVYHTPLTSFDVGAVPEGVYTVPLLARGQVVLEELSLANGWGFDAADIQYYTQLFVDVLQRDPTNVELFDLSQSNSEHSRHWFFGGKMVIDGCVKEETLFDMVKSTLPKSSNSLIAFHDNSSVRSASTIICFDS